MDKNPNSVYKVRFSDCDLFGHLNNARYIDYFMNAREDHLKDHHKLNLTDYYQKGLAWVVTRHEIAYLRPAVYDEMVDIETILLLAAPDSLLVELIMRDEKRSHLKAIMRTEFTPVNPKTGKRETHPEDFMQLAKSIENNLVGTGKNLDERIKELRIIKNESAVV